MFKKVVLALALGVASAQQAGTLVEEVHPTLSISLCDEYGCNAQQKSITIDSNWRWLENNGVNCYTGNTWNDTVCPGTEDGATSCAQNCALEGATYEETYGITTEDDSLTLDFVTYNTADNLTNVGSRVYLMESDDMYYMFNLKNKEFAFDVDVSNLPCGLNGALYFVEMDVDGGMNKYEDNNAGAKFGTGYCDAQCPHDLKFINGAANTIDWTPSDTDVNAGTGKYGTCCVEMDIWEANSISAAYTPHSCTVEGQTQCSGQDCGDNSDDDPDSRFDGVCDKNGCDLNPYRFGITDFHGPGSDFTLDTTQKMTVITRFNTDDQTEEGNLVSIERIYIQNGNVIKSPDITMGSTTYNAIDDDFCIAAKKYFNETPNGFEDEGGMQSMSDSMGRGQVLVMSLWDDHAANMLWLDSTYPPDGDASQPGVARGTCSTDSGDPKDVEANVPDSSVVFSAIKIGSIGSTYKIDG